MVTLYQTPDLADYGDWAGTCEGLNRKTIGGRVKNAVLRIWSHSGRGRSVSMDTSIPTLLITFFVTQPRSTATLVFKATSKH